MKIDELPRKAVLSYLEMSRLPLTAAERALGKVEGTWGPTIAVDRLQARVKDVAASVLKDDTLRADAKLQLAAIDERLRAAEAEARAEQIRAEADRRLAQDARAAQEAKQEVLKREARREQAAESAAEAAERAVKEKAAAKKSQARKVDAALEDALEKRENVVQRDLLANEAKALNNQRAATQAKAEVLELDDKLQATKAARKQRP